MYSYVLRPLEVQVQTYKRLCSKKPPKTINKYCSTQCIQCKLKLGDNFSRARSSEALFHSQMSTLAVIVELQPSVNPAWEGADSKCCSCLSDQTHTHAAIHTNTPTEHKHILTCLF